MEQTYLNQDSRAYAEGVAMPRTFLASVFSWMATALGISAVTAYYMASNPANMAFMFTESGLSGMGYVVMFAPLGFVLAMGLGFQRLSSTVLLGLFLVYSLIMGVSLSFIFLIYTAGSITTTFGIAAGMFSLMAVVGYTTKVDLTKFGSLMMMGLVGIIIASVVNMFMKSSMMDYIISFIGVAVFTGLTAYDVQKLKKMGSEVSSGTEVYSKMAIMGALSLYLDFVNLFLMLLRFFGNRK